MNVSKINDSMKEFVKKHGSTRLIASLKSIMLFLKKIQQFVWTVWSKIIKNHINLWVNANKPKRYLEIGSGNNRLPGFETLDIFGGRYVDYVYNAARPLPFRDNTFDLIYASHVLEHIPWYMTEQVLREWFRILKPTGQLEVWVPDGLKICKVLVDVELGGGKTKHIKMGGISLTPRGTLMFGSQVDFMHMVTVRERETIPIGTGLYLRHHIF